MQNVIFCLLGASCTGKTTIARYLREELGFVELISSTTRNMREGEIDGVTYHYVSKEEFDELNKIEEVEYSGNKYALTEKEVNYKIKHFDKVFCIVDKEGVEQLSGKYNTVVVYVWSTPFECFMRLVKRDGTHEAHNRIKHAYDTKEFSNHDIADYIIRSKDGEIDKIKKQIQSIVSIEMGYNNKNNLKQKYENNLFEINE